MNEKPADNQPEEVVRQRITDRLKTNILGLDPVIISKLAETIRKNHQIHNNISLEDPRRVSLTGLMVTDGNMKGSLQIDVTVTPAGLTETDSKVISFHLPLASLDQEKQIETSRKVWDGVSREDQKAIALQEIERMLKDDKGTIEGAKTRLREGEIKENEANFFILQAAHRQTLLLIAKGLIKIGRFDISIHPADATLLIVPKLPPLYRLRALLERLNPGSFFKNPGQ